MARPYPGCLMYVFIPCSKLNVASLLYATLDTTKQFFFDRKSERNAAPRAPLEEASNNFKCASRKRGSWLQLARNNCLIRTWAPKQILLRRRRYWKEGAKSQHSYSRIIKITYFACNSAMTISFSPTVMSNFLYLFTVPSSLHKDKIDDKESQFRLKPYHYKKPTG